MLFALMIAICVGNAPYSTSCDHHIIQENLTPAQCVSYSVSTRVEGGYVICDLQEDRR